LRPTPGVDRSSHRRSIGIIGIIGIIDIIAITA